MTKVQQLDKAVRVVNSCKNMNHLKVAIRYVTFSHMNGYLTEYHEKLLLRVLIDMKEDQLIY